MESRKLICTCDESESGFNCWRVKLKWNESCSKHEEYQGKGGQKKWIRQAHSGKSSASLSRLYPDYFLSC